MRRRVFNVCFIETSGEKIEETLKIYDNLGENAVGMYYANLLGKVS